MDSFVRRFLFVMSNLLRKPDKILLPAFTLYKEI